MSVFHENMLIGSSGQGGAAAYSIDRSLRFNSADSAYLSRTPGSAGNRKTWTWAGWVKRSGLGVNYRGLLSVQSGTSDTTFFQFGFDDTNKIIVYGYNALWRQSTSVYRDPSAWYHIVLAVDTTNGTANDRIKLYVNGAQVTTFDSLVNLTSSADLGVNATNLHQIGSSATNYKYDGYLADIHFIDGQALTPSSFGETNATTGVWVPKEFTGTYGTNGFKLNFSNNSATTAATLGADTSGNGNNWTPNNFSVTAGAGNDSLRDSPTNGTASTGGDAGGVTVGNYATFNPLNSDAGCTFANGNLEVSTASGTAKTGFGIPTSGKWYWEGTFVAPAATDGWMGVGNPTLSNIYGYRVSGQKFTGTGSWTSYGATYGQNDIIGVALDQDNNTITFYKNNVSQGSITSVTSLVRLAVCNNDGSTGWVFNFGQRAFAYTAPSGFKGLCTANLPAPAIVKPDTVMDVKLYTGNGTSQTVSGFNFSPDFVWIKRRDVAAAPVLADTVRGAGNILRSNGTNAELTGRTDIVDSFTSTGFVVGYDGLTNANTGTYVGWAWDSASSNATNTSGTITSTIRASTSSGFSIATYTGTGSNATVGHGLGAAPQFIIVKSRSNATEWHVYHASVGNTKRANLQITNAFTTDSTAWNNTSPTSSVFSVGTNSDINSSGATYVAYCWTPVSSYSAFGSYTGNGSSDGVFVHTSMRPRWILLKRTDTTSNWTMIDAIREGYNVDNDPLFANLADVEGTTDLVDILSNGFKLRSTDASVNASSGTYVYACFAESPFQYARAR